MSKRDDFDPPPSYESVTGEPFPAPQTTIAQFHPSFYTAHLAGHLSSLPTYIRRSNATHASVQSSRDVDVLGLLVPHIEALLDDVGASVPPPTLAELTLVPAAAVPLEWKPSDEDASGGRRNRSTAGDGMLRRFIRVPLSFRGGGGKEKKDGKPPTAAAAMDGDGDDVNDERERELRLNERMERMQEGARGSTFDEWGRWGDDAAGDSPSVDKWDAGEWWWSDENSATRLARHLQPPKPPQRQQQQQSTPRPMLSAARVPGPAFAEEPKSRGRLWGLFRSSTGSCGVIGPPAAPQTPPPQSEPEPPRKQAGGAEVVMTVRAEEVTFRKENEFGVWESKSGWGIVVRVRVRD